MKENMHIEKELLFKNNIKDITSISLDSNYRVEDNYIVGDFLIDGEYKIHELSINKDKFNFKVPFKHELDRSVNTDSVKLEIDNFTYDYKKDELIVDIDYSLIGDKEEVLEFDSKELLDDYLRDKEVEIISDRIDDIKDDLVEITEEDVNNIVEKEEVEEERNIVNDDKKEDIVEYKEKVVEEDRKEVVDKMIGTTKENINMDNIINNVNSDEDKYITYKVYKLNENETLESVVIKYHITIDELKEYNDINNLSVGDKIIIPKYE